MSVSTTVESEPTVRTEVARVRMSYEEWLAWDYEGGLTEWVDGEVLIYMPATATHQAVVQFLSTLLGTFAQLFGLGAVLTGPYSMRAIPGRNGREPDIMFIASEHLDRLTEKELSGPADLVVEVISDDSVARDRDDKFFEYQLGGVPEYWILDPRANRLRADFYRLDAQGRYQPVPVAADGIYHSVVLPGFWLKVDWLWQENPNPLAALAEIAGMDQLVSKLQAQHR